MNNRLYLLFEFIVLYIGLPLLFYFNLIPIPKIIALLIVALITTLILWFDDRYDFSQLFIQPEENHHPKMLLWKSLFVTVVLIILVLLSQPSALFAFPRQRPVFWMIIMLLYPLLSALPQELIYRAFFFQRYQLLFPSKRILGFASIAAFAGLHIIYDNWWAIGLSLAGGYLFVRTYRKTKSLYWVSVEHAIYGCLVFTIGMGGYFYEAFYR